MLRFYCLSVFERFQVEPKAVCESGMLTGVSQANKGARQSQGEGMQWL